MKRYILFITLLYLCISVKVCGQRYADISANNIKASFNSGGILYSVDTGRNGTYGLYEVPKGSGRKTIFASAPWLTALDNYNGLVGGFSLYDSNANFRFGPVAYYNLPQYESTYNKVFKITHGEIR